MVRNETQRKKHHFLHLLPEMQLNVFLWKGSPCDNKYSTLYFQNKWFSISDTLFHSEILEMQGITQGNGSALIVQFVIFKVFPEL